MDKFDLKYVFDFLNDLRSNNDRDWFNENRTRYTNAKKEFESFINELIPAIKDIDKSIDVNSSKECMFRIFRDVRFSKNKEPYKTNFGAFIAKGGRKSSYSGYYLHFEPESSFLGGGIYMPQPIFLKSIRTEIVANTNEFKKIINNETFKNTFGEIFGEKLKSAPRGFPKDFPDLELIKHKHFAVSHEVENDFWFKKNVINSIINIFKTQTKFNNYLNIAIHKTIIETNKKSENTQSEEEFVKKNFGM